MIFRCYRLLNLHLFICTVYRTVSIPSPKGGSDRLHTTKKRIKKEEKKPLNRPVTNLRNPIAMRPCLCEHRYSCFGPHPPEGPSSELQVATSYHISCISGEARSWQWLIPPCPVIPAQFGFTVRERGSYTLTHSTLKERSHFPNLIQQNAFQAKLNDTHHPIS